jgi:hypothetical protein
MDVTSSLRVIAINDRTVNSISQGESPGDIKDPCLGPAPNSPLFSLSRFHSQFLRYLSSSTIFESQRTECPSGYTIMNNRGTLAPSL